MFDKINQIYDNYPSEGGPDIDQGMYNTALNEAIANIEIAVKDNRLNITPLILENKIGGAMADAKRLGFYEGFIYATKLWAECLQK